MDHQGAIGSMSTSFKYLYVGIEGAISYGHIVRRYCKPGYEEKLIFNLIHLVIGENQVKLEAAYEIKILYND